MNSIRKIFENTKLWSSILPHYQIREGQIDLSENIYQTIQNQSILVAEAGTGTGKTIAYLLPALLYLLENSNEEQRIVISTETKTLQNQILYKDISILEKIFHQSIPAEICLGSQNYICIRRMKQFLNKSNYSFPSREKFLEWEEKTQEGIIFHYPGTIPDDMVSEIVRVPSLCAGSQCKYFSHSYYFLAKEKWKKAKILIVNHHLLSAHILGNGNILPEFQIAIIDEAHSFPEIFRDNSILYFSFQEVKKLIKKYRLESLLEKEWLEFFQHTEQFLNTKQFEIKKRIETSWEIEGLFSFINQLEKGIQNLEQERKKDLFDSFQWEVGEELELRNGIEYFKSVLHILELFYEGPAYNRVHYIEKNQYDIKFCIATVDVSKSIREQFLEKVDTCIFTSATLSTGKSFQYFLNKTGLSYYDHPDYVRTLMIPSPFDYQKQAILYLPENIPDPAHTSYLERCTKEVVRLIQLVKGNILIIFTSRQSLNYVYNQIVKQYKNQLKDIHLFSQEILGPRNALKQYLETENAVLFGLESFRQGIDLAGEQLKCVILIKLPFSVPTDPVYFARMEMEKEKNRNPFFTIQIPEMIIKLKQGAGRLIRTESDKGIIAILDPRIHTKYYGKMILDSLPDYKMIKDFSILKEEYEKNLLLKL